METQDPMGRETAVKELPAPQGIGNFWPLVPEVILLIFSPLIVWRLSRSSTAHWFKGVTAAEARKRHGGTWVWFIALWGIVVGVLQTIASMK